MVGFISEPSTIEDDDQSQASKGRNFKDPVDPFDTKLTNFSDSFSDFDSIKEFFEDPESLVFEKRMEAEENGSVSKEIPVNGSDSLLEEKGIVGVSDFGGLMKVKEESLELERAGNRGCSIEEVKGVAGGSDLGDSVKVTGESVELERAGSMGCSIEEEMGRVSLAAGLSFVASDGNVLKSEKVPVGEVEVADGSITGPSSIVGSDSGNNGKVVIDMDKIEYHSKSESEISSASISSESSSDDEEEGQEEVRLEVNNDVDGMGDLEEGEIRNINEEIVGKNDSDVEDFEEDEGKEGNLDEMVEWGDNDDEDMDEAGVKGRPIRSKNELVFLPPVPRVDASLQPHHKMLPVGVVLSAIGPQVIVEGVEKHVPLNEGSILWITERRSPLGLVDEIFGPVKNPYYVVRYNSESEVPAEIHSGTLISFVPEFANHVLNDNNLYTKGYDASGENDEEVAAEPEFSDDEKEAEYKRMLKMSKRGMNDEVVGKKKNNRKKGKNKDGGWKNNKPSGQQISMGAGQLPPNNNLLNVSSVETSFSSVLQANGVFAPSNSVWTSMAPSQQPQTPAVPGGFPANSIPWPAHSVLQDRDVMPMPNTMPNQQRFHTGQGPLPNALLPGGQPNFFAGPAYALPWLTVGGQNYFNQATFGTGFQVQPTFQAMNMLNQGMISSGLPLGQNCNFQPSTTSLGSLEVPQPFIAGASPGNIQAPQPFKTGASPGNAQASQPFTTGASPGNIQTPQPFTTGASSGSTQATQPFNTGFSSSHGRKPYRRGGGRFTRGRGRQPSK